MNDFVYEDIAIESRSRNMSLGIYMEKCLYKSSRVEVYESKVFGRCLYLDSALQTSTRDECNYHEPLAHIPMKLAKNRKRVLVIGGGDGGTLREVLKHSEVEKVVLCEISQEVVDVSIKFLPEFDLEANVRDSRVELRIEDGVKYVEQFSGEKFDVVIVDCPDPSPESSKLHSRNFFENVFEKVLVADGAFGIQSGNAFIKEDAVKADRHELRRLFKHVTYYYSPIPSFPSGGIGFLFAAQDVKKIQLFDIDTRYLNVNTIESGKGMFPKTLFLSHRAKFLNNFEWEYCVDDIQLMVARKFCEFEDEPKQEAFKLFEVEQSESSVPLVTFLTVDHVDEIHPLITLLMDSRGEVPPSGRKLNGLSLNRSTISYHSIVTTAEFKREYPDLAAFHEEPYYDSVLISFTYAGGKLIEITSRVADMSREYEVVSDKGEALAFYGDESYIKKIREKHSNLKDAGVERLMGIWKRDGFEMTSLRYEKPFGWVAVFSYEGNRLTF